MSSAGHRDGTTGPGTRAEDVSWPLAAAGDPGRALPGQIARFGDLAGRDLSFRAIAALRARGAYDPQRHGDAEVYEPLSPGEQREMLALRAAITRDYRAYGDGADAGAAGLPRGIMRPIRLSRPPSSGSQDRAPARHRRGGAPAPG